MRVAPSGGSSRRRAAALPTRRASAGERSYRLPASFCQIRVRREWFVGDQVAVVILGARAGWRFSADSDVVVGDGGLRDGDRRRGGGDAVVGS